MGYVAVKGGEKAIENALKLLNYERIKGKSKPLEVEQIREQLYLAVDKIMGEASLYAPDLAALAIKQSVGDMFEASFYLRAYRSTKERIGNSIPVSTKEMRIIRRISAAFQDIPGGQILGPTNDYALRLLDFSLFKDAKNKRTEQIKDLFKGISVSQKLPESFPKVVDLLRKEGLLVDNNSSEQSQPQIFDITRKSLTFPLPRSGVLQAMARGETGGLLLLAYSNMRGYGDVHPTIGELRVGYLPVKYERPGTGEILTIGEVKVTEAEVIAKFTSKDGTPKFSLGYGLCFGQNEIKAISMAILDKAMQSEEANAISEMQEFVISHIDGVESMGFCTHYKLPHYVTFQSDLDRLRKVQKEHKKNRESKEVLKECLEN